MKIIILILYCAVIINEVNGHHCVHSNHECTDTDDDDYDKDEEVHKHHSHKHYSRELHHPYINEVYAEKIHRRFPEQETVYKGIVTNGPFEMEQENGLPSAGMFRYPFAVAILRKNTFYANGVLVDRKWVLSSAKEFYGRRTKSFSARLGSLNARRGGVLIKIKKIIIFPLYIHNEPNYDIALLKLRTAVDLTRDVQTISWTKNDLSIFLTIYWPKIYFNGKYVAKNAPERINHRHLRSTTQTSIYREECSKRLARDNLALERTTICFDPIQSLHSPCVADPGAPVLSYTGLMGITSSWVSPRCKLHPLDSPVIVTRTSSPMIRSWMREIIVKKKYGSRAPKYKAQARRIVHGHLHPAIKKAHEFKKLLNHNNLDHKHIDGMM